MGATYIHGYTKAQVVADATKPYVREDGVVFTTTHQKVIESQLWFVRTTPEGPQIYVAILSKSGGNWGYYVIPESQGPAYYKCPLAFFQQAPVPTGKWSAAWRESVVRYHALAGIQVGDVIECEQPIAFKLGSAYRFRLNGTYKGSLVFTSVDSPQITPNGVILSIEDLLFAGGKVV